MVVLPIFLFFLGWVRCQELDDEPLPCAIWETKVPQPPEYEKYCYDPCKKFTSWVQRDKCYCDTRTNTSRCDVYCKQPYLDNSVCEEMSSGNDEFRDEWRCLYLNIEEACINYCNRSGTIDQDCWCTYVKPDPLCPKYCNTGTPDDDKRKLECGCKYHSDDSTSITEDCYNYCNKEMHAETWAEYLKCQCTYLSNSSACQALCNAAGNDDFSRYECLCFLDRKKGLNYTTYNCQRISDLIVPIAVPDDVTVPKYPTEDGYNSSNPADYDPSKCDYSSNHPLFYNCSTEERADIDEKEMTRKRKITEKRARDILKGKIDQANLVITKDAKTVSECYYGEDIDVCRNYCDSLNDTNRTDSCLCTKMNDKESCAAVCEHEIANETAMLECQCMIDPKYCEQYCIKRFVKDPSDPEYKVITENKEFQECNCTLSSGEEGTESNPSCGLFCEMVFNPTKLNVTEREERRGLCENFCMAQTTEANPDGQSMCQCQTLHEDSGCEPFCRMLNETRNSTIEGFCRKYCMSHEWAEDQTDCLCTHSVDGHFCRDYCLPGIGNEGFSLPFCETYCNALDTSQGLKCRCSYLDGSKCIDYCNYFGNTTCNATLEELEVVGKNWTNNRVLQECLEEVPEVLNCYCSFGIGLSNKRGDLNGACIKECDALGRTGRVVERARCVCRNQINITACADYCDMSLAGHANSRHLRDKCKCDYEQGDEYCKAYSLSLPHENHLKYECTVRNNKSACYDYCLNYVSPLGNEIETYKCWCEMYGDIVWCPVYCDSLRPSDYAEGSDERNELKKELFRCKCFHYDDTPSCNQYCPVIPNEKEKIECQCLILNESAGCKVYCDSLPTYGERIVCSCVHGLDQARCKEIATLKVGALKEKEPPESEIRRPYCDLEVKEGTEYDKACQLYCMAVQKEAAPQMYAEVKKKEMLAIEQGGGLTPEELVEKAKKYIEWESEEVRLTCYCDVFEKQEACELLCNKHYPERDPNGIDPSTNKKWTDKEVRLSKGYHARCLCQHRKNESECKRSCDLIYPRNDTKLDRVMQHKQDALNSECMCNVTVFVSKDSANYKEAFDHCGKSCELRYGINRGINNTDSVKFYACLMQYDLKKEHNDSFCKAFHDEQMQMFCNCFYHEGDDRYCGKIICDVMPEDSNATGEMPTKAMCKCVMGHNDSCNVFCKDEWLSRKDCNKSCNSLAGDDSKAKEYDSCLCTAIGSRVACKSVCDQFYPSNKTAYHECRCKNKLGTLSCASMCADKYNVSTDPESAYEKCMRANVTIKIGVVEGKERYSADYDVDDVYDFDDIPKVWVREVEEKEEEEEEKEVEEEKQEEEEEKKEVEEEKEEEEEEEEEEAVQELKKEEVADEPVTKQGWFTNKTNMLLVIMASSVFAVAVVAAIIVVIAVYRLGNSSAAGDGEKSTTMFEMGEENPTEKAETSLDPSNEFAEEQKKAPGEEMDLNVDE